MIPVRNRNVCFINPDQVYGQDEMLGFSIMNALKSGANLAFNPLAQARMLGNVARGAAGGLAHTVSPTQPMMPPPPMLNPSMGQAGAQHGGNTIHAYMGLGAGVFESTGPTGDLPSFSAEPQSAFIGNRLVLAARYATGAEALQVTITSPLTVSGMPQTPAPSQPAPIEMFEAATTYSSLDLQIATSATQIAIGFSISATPGTGVTVALSGGLFGQWIR